LPALSRLCSGDDNEIAGQRGAFRRRGQAFQALVECEALEIGRHRDRFAARGKTVAAEIEAHDLLDALDADIEHAVGIFGERFNIEPAARGERLAVGAEDRRHLGIGEARGLAVLVDDAGAQPGAVVGDAEEVGAVAIHMNGGHAAKRFVFRGQRQAAAEFQLAEPGL
jgi:hypothetical protein